MHSVMGLTELRFKAPLKAGLTNAKVAADDFSLYLLRF